MSRSSSPVNGGYEAANVEPTMRLTVRKDLFPEIRLPKVVSVIPSDTSIQDDIDDISCVKLETDFEQSIDEIANQKLQTVNGIEPSHEKPRHRKHKQHSRRDFERSKTHNGSFSKDSKRKKSSRELRPHRTAMNSTVPSQVTGGKNLNLVSSSECPEVDDDSSEDEILHNSIKLPTISVPRQSGKPYSHQLSQLSNKKSKHKEHSKQRKPQVVIPCSGKPRSMLGIGSSKSRKKIKKSECTATYRSQILDTNNIKITIRRTNIQNMVTPTSVADIGQRKSKKKKASSPVPSESSGEEYDPMLGDTAASMSVAAPKPRNQPPPKTRKSNTRSNKNSKTENKEGSKSSLGGLRNFSSQSRWAREIPEEVLVKIFQDVVSLQGTLPTVVKLGKVCKLWYSVSCRPELWRNVDLATYTSEKCKTDYKLTWLLENRMLQCHTLNLAHWKICNVSWVLACLADYCPALTELSVAGWRRLTAEQLFNIFQTLPRLKRLDLSVTSEMGGSGSCLSAASVARVTESYGERITHLTLANNKFTALQQILTSIAAHCSNLEVLDISGAQATSHPAVIPLEALQKGCPKMRVFRAANAQLVLTPATTAQQMECSGWCSLEELSVAGDAATERVGVGEYRLGDDAVARLVRGATTLKLLDLRGLQRLTDSGLVRVPAWDLQHLFLGGCNVTRQNNSGLELICEKWAHSLIELDLSWGTAARALDTAVETLAENRESKLKVLNLCGSAVSLEPVKKVLLRCRQLESINLSSCRALPRGMKRLYTGKELQDLKDSLDPEKSKTKDKTEDIRKGKKSSDDSKTSDAESTPKHTTDCKIKDDVKESCSASSSPAQESKKYDAGNVPEKQSEQSSMSDCKSVESLDKLEHASKTSRDSTPKLLSPCVQLKPDSSSTPRSDTSKTDMGSPHFSPLSKPDSLNSPDVQQDVSRSSSSWNLGQFKTTPTHKSEASPLNRLENQNKMKQCKMMEQCSPTTSHDNKLSPEAIQNKKQDLININNWNYGSYSPMPRQEGQLSQCSPYSAQPSPAQPSPYSAQPSPYSTQPSPYSSQPSPYSAQPSPDTSQMVKQDHQKTGQWNTGNYSPMTKHPAPFSPRPATHTSPDAGLGVKSDTIRSNSNKTSGQYSPMSRQERIHQSPYSPRPNVENVVYSNKKSPGVGNYSPLMRQDCHLPSPDGGQTPRSLVGGRQDAIYSRTVSKSEVLPTTPDTNAGWGIDRFGQLTGTPTSNIDPSLVWSTTYSNEPAMMQRSVVDNIPSMLNTPPPQQNWSGLPSFESSVRRRTGESIQDPWTLGQFRVEPPHQMHNTFVEQNVNFESLNTHIGHQSHIPQSYLDDSFSESRVD